MSYIFKYDTQVWPCIIMSEFKMVKFSVGVQYILLKNNLQSGESKIASYLMWVTLFSCKIWRLNKGIWF